MWVQMHVHVCVWRLETKLGCHSLGVIYLAFEAGTRLAGQCTSRICLCLHSQLWDYICMSHLPFLHGFWRLDFSSHAWIASTLLIDLILYFCLLFFISICVHVCACMFSCMCEYVWLHAHVHTCMCVSVFLWDKVFLCSLSWSGILSWLFGL